jgi:hypothetical protein
MIQNLVIYLENKLASATWRKYKSLTINAPEDVLRDVLDRYNVKQYNTP